MSSKIQISLSFLSKTKRGAGSAAKAEDEGSLASTVTSSSTNSIRSWGWLHQRHQSLPLAKGPGDVPKHTGNVVRFDEIQNTSFRNTQVCEEDIKKQWYSALDFERFKSETLIVGHEILRKESSKFPERFSYQGVLQLTFEMCCQCTSETDGSVLSRQQEEDLMGRMRRSSAWVGLERQIVRAIVLDKCSRRRRLISLVSTPTNVSQMGEAAIRKACMKISRPSRLFARQIAQAHAAENTASF